MIVDDICQFYFRRKKFLEKLKNPLKSTPIEATLYELALEFLRLYDGKFNYPEGHLVKDFIVVRFQIELFLI